MKPCGSSQAPPSGTKLSSPPVFEHYIIISPTADSFLLIHLHFTFIRSISVLIFLLLFCLIHPPAVWTTLPTIASSSALLLSPSSSTFLLFHPTTLTSLPGIRVQRSYSGHQWKHVTATIWPPPLLFLLWFVHFPSLFIFWLCFIYSCIYRSFFFCFQTMFPIILRSLIIASFMAFPFLLCFLLFHCFSHPSFHFFTNLFNSLSLSLSGSPEGYVRVQLSKVENKPTQKCSFTDHGLLLVFVVFPLYKKLCLMSWQFHTVNILGRFRGALQRNDPRSDAGDGSASDHQRGTVPEQPRKHADDGFTGLRPQSGPQPGRKTQRGQNSVCILWNHTELKTSRKRTKIKNRKWRNLRLQRPWDPKRISSGIS